MSDSANVGDAARLEAALERIVSALRRAMPTPATGPDPHAPDRDAPPEPALPALDVAQIDVAQIDVAQIGARLDGLIAELRDVLGEEAGQPGPPSHP